MNTFPYLPLTEAERQKMLAFCHVRSMEQLLSEIPESLRLNQPVNLPEPQSEPELVDTFIRLANQNFRPELSFLGAGSYQHYIPSVIDHLAGRSEFYSTYTPYQPEISQGILQAIFEYQTMIAELFGLPVANASLYDGPTALAEAVLMAARETKRSKILIPSSIHPFYRQVLSTYTRNQPITLMTIPAEAGAITLSTLQKFLDPETAAFVIQNPNFWGIIENLPEIIPTIKEQGAVPICCVHPLTLGLLESPGQLGAEIVVGEGQPLGIPPAYGGPTLGLMAVSERFLRRIPGRLVGETHDHDGRRAFVLTLQTREQHIRREKATSNICSNQALCAIRAAIYLAVVGPGGLREIAQRAFNNAHYLQERLSQAGFPLFFNQPFFMEFTVKTPKPAASYTEKLISRGILPGLDIQRFNPAMDHALLICATEIYSKDQLDRLVEEMRCL